MGSGWRRARNALRLNSFNACVSGQPEPQDSPTDETGPDLQSTPDSGDGGSGSSRRQARTVPSIPRPASRLNHLIRPNSRLSRSTCAICLESMKPGYGHALFTAECSHVFHFSCIASNVRHGNLVCPVCRSKWKEVPWMAPADLPSANDVGHRPAGSSRTRRTQHVANASNYYGMPPGDGDVEDEDQRRPDPVLRILDENIANARGIRRLVPQEPTIFNDDEPLDSHIAAPPADAADDHSDVLLPIGDGGSPRMEGRLLPAVEEETQQNDGVKSIPGEGEGTDASPLAPADTQPEILLTCHPEVDAVPASERKEAFTVLVHLKSLAGTQPRLREKGPSGPATLSDVLNPTTRAPLDLVTVLDISGSMAGTKLGLLKRAMAFVIRNLSASDRLSVVAFSSSARRLFPLRRMMEDGRLHALRCVDSLVSTGGTNIADGLRKGAKILDERTFKNRVASIMLLSDGQDTYTLGNRGQFSGLITVPPAADEPNPAVTAEDIRHLLPGSLRPRPSDDGDAVRVPVHTFGFGADHDAATMHAISEISGGTFSFVEAEAVVQDAFAQCIGGLLSVVAQATTLSIAVVGVEDDEEYRGGSKLCSIEAGSYEATISWRRGEVKLGDLYAEEERDILLQLTLPSVPEIPASSSVEADGEQAIAPAILRVSCSFCDPLSGTVRQSLTEDVRVSRPQAVDAAAQSVSLEVDRQRNRVRIARTIFNAGHLADSGEIAAAQQILSLAREALHNSVSFQAGDHLSTGLDAELIEIQARVANRQIYERTGRAYILSAQSSHFRQRATTRGDSSDTSTRDYQTSSMSDMVVRSQHPDDWPSGSGSPPRERKGPHSGRAAVSISPNRSMLLRRNSGRVRDSHGHRDSSPNLES